MAQTYLPAKGNGHKKPPIVKWEDYIELPPDLRMEGTEVDLAIDVVYINREVFLHTVDRTIKEPTCVILGTYNKGEAPTSETLFQAIDEVLRKYNRSDIRIATIHANNEFTSVLKDLVVSKGWFRALLTSSKSSSSKLPQLSFKQVNIY